VARASTVKKTSTPAVDPFGYDPEFHASVRPISEFFYRTYWRVHTDGLENIPATGAALIVGNHSGGIPFDAAMITAAVDLEHPQHRLVRYLYDKFVEGMPLVGDAYRRLGSLPASVDNARLLLRHHELVGIFPEGVAGVAKGVMQRYRLQPFRSSFVRLAVEENVPLIPVTVVGAEEIYPIVGKLTTLGGLTQLLSVPYIPVTPLFPLLGPLGVIPLPTKWHIRFGEPIWLTKDAPKASARKVWYRSTAERIRRDMQATLHQMLAQRESMF
jgi:1-acyl-sn-glycerol-3-phosphate acyltransferase